MHNSIHAAAPSAPSWSAHSATLSSIADEEADADEPPDSRLPYSPIKDTFKRNPIRRSIDHQHQSSLLTRALHSTSEDDADDHSQFFTLRRPTKSNASLASTADLTSDTGLTSPSRTNTPSPPLPELRFLNLNGDGIDGEKHAQGLAPAAEVKKEPRKRCIQFACAAKPTSKPVEQPTPVVAPAPVPAAASKPQRKRCIKFACPAPRSTPTQSTPPAVERLEAAAARLHPSRETSPATVRKARPTSHSRSPRPPRSRHSSRGGDTPRKALPQKKYITCTDRDLHHDAARFHEFASDDHSDEDWIRETAPAQARKLTINDTLAKENEIRRLAAEAEAEAEDEEDQEDAENVAGIDDEDDEDDDEDDIDDGLSGYATEDEEEDEEDDEDDEDDDSVGYHTDEETGFAASDDENDDLQLWTPAQPAARLSGVSSVPRRTSVGAQSDSSIGSFSSIRAVRFGKVRRMKIRPGTPELPDSTDFVCGTLDEDRPMEEAYISCMAARRREKHVVIPQDIDPSFPASDPEDEAEEEFNPVKHASDDEDVWLHGEMDDLHHEQERRSRKKKSDHSPKRYHSPPPNKRHHSPPTALKARGRSPAPPKGLFDRRSPRRIRSPPPPMMLRSPPASLRNGPPAMNINKELGTRPGLTVTKSLPRPSAMFPLRRRGAAAKIAVPEADSDVHVRSAIDIVKGLEQKRQRRKEKYYQKYCNRARKGQVHERKPLPGTGCERMRELGLIMAGKIDQGNYVLSI